MAPEPPGSKGVSRGTPESAMRYFRFAGLTLTVTVAVAALGWIPTRRWGGEEALAGLIAGCLVSLAAALIGGLVILRAERGAEEGVGESGVHEAGTQPLFAGLKAMGVRLLVLLGLGTTVAVSGAVGLKPFLLWLGGSYLVLLPVETRYALAMVKGLAAGPAKPGGRKSEAEVGTRAPDEAQRLNTLDTSETTPELKRS